METETERLFIALPLPIPVREASAAVARPLPGITWTKPEHLHLTLRFLGDVPVSQHEAMIERLSAVRVASFSLPIQGLGTFPAQRPPRILWAGVGKGHPRLFQLRQRLDDALLAAGLTTLDLRTFHPHTTLARCKGDVAPAVAGWLRFNRDFEAPPFQVETFELHASTLGPGGAQHRLKHRFPLAD